MCILSDIHIFKKKKGVKRTMENSPYIANLLVPFCEAASVNIRYVDQALIKRIIVSLSFIDTENLHNILFPTQHIDWNGVKEYLRDVQYSTNDWIQLVNLIDFHNEELPDQTISDIIASTLAGMKVSMHGKTYTPIDSLRICFAKGGISPTWDTLCKAFLLLNLTDIENTVILEYLLSNTPNIRENNAINDIIKNMPNIFRHSPHEYLSVFSKLLRTSESCHIRSHVILNSLKTKEDILEKKRISHQQIFSQNSKPSLTKIFEMHQQCQTNDKNMLDSFNNFCDIVNLPSTQNMHLKRIIYYLKCSAYSASSCKAAVDIYEQKYLPRLVNNDMAVLDAIRKIDIITPDMFAIKKLLTEAYYSGIPFTSLKHFKNTFFSHLEQGGGKGAHWSTIFRLYLVIYCRPEIVKDLWTFVWSLNDGTKHQYSKLISNSDSYDSIQQYVLQHPISLDESLDMLLSTI